MKRFVLTINSTVQVLLVSGLLLGSLFGCAIQPDKVHVEKNAPDIVTKVFDRGVRPPEASNPEHNDCANTHWHFGFEPDIYYDLLKRERVSDGEAIALKIKKINIKLNLDIKMWIPEKASPDVVAHENGHAAICVNQYKNAQSIADEIAVPWIGKEVGAQGIDFETTLKRVLNEVKHDMAGKYNAETLEKANVIGGLYDQMTKQDHDAAKVNQKVADAELEYVRIAPELKAKKEEQLRLLMERKSAPEPDLRDLNSVPRK